MPYISIGPRGYSTEDSKEKVVQKLLILLVSSRDNSVAKSGSSFFYTCTLSARTSSTPFIRPLAVQLSLMNARRLSSATQQL